MNKVLLIIQREYMVRVKKKSFIMMIFLVPALILAMFGVIYLIATYSNDMNKTRTVWVMDESGVFTGKFQNKNKLAFQTVTKSLVDEKSDLRKNEDDFLLVIPSDYSKTDAVQIFSKKEANFTIAGEIEDQMNTIATGNKMVTAGIDTVKLHAIKSNISIVAKQITDKGEQDSSIGAAYGAGIAGAILVYLALCS